MEKTYSIADKATNVRVFTLDDLLRTMDEWTLAHQCRPGRLWLSPALHRHLGTLANNGQEITVQTFYGMQILVDPALRHGEWRFEAAKEQDHDDG